MRSDWRPDPKSDVRIEPPPNQMSLLAAGSVGACDARRWLALPAGYWALWGIALGWLVQVGFFVEMCRLRVGVGRVLSGYGIF